MTTELQEFLEIVDCKEIQGWFNYEFSSPRIEVKGKIVKLPTIDQLIEMLGSDFNCVCRKCEDEYYVLVHTHDDKIYAKCLGQSARIALARAVKEIKNGK